MAEAPAPFSENKPSVESMEPVKSSDHAAVDGHAKGDKPEPALTANAVAESVLVSQPIASAPIVDTAYRVEALYFDAAWYLAAYPDVEACGIDAVEHFMTHGYLEGRDPNAFFSVALYMEANPDIPLTINPFLHFIMHGAAEGRRLRP